MINILILSVGTRNKIVEYFKDALTEFDGKRIGNVIATDMSEIAPAIYVADRYYKVPCMTTDGYIDIIFDICKKENITAILSLIDPELTLLAEHEKKFEEKGVLVIGSCYRLCEMSLDKMKMYEWLTLHGYRTARSYAERESFYSEVEAGIIGYPVFIKPVRGSASIEINKVWNKETIEILYHNSNALMIQEFLNGQEIGADVYIDLISGEVISIFTKRKIVMRAGETDKAISFKDKKLFDLIEKFVKEAGYRGQIDIDIFEIEGEYYISEVNPRFGGGYPHAYECGCNHMKLIVENLKGKINKKCIAKYEEGICMMKYNELLTKALTIREGTKDEE